MRCLTIVVCLSLLATTAYAQKADESPLRVHIDARDLPRKLVQAELMVPIEASKSGRKVALWYPKWVPGSHGPGGPVANVGGLKIEDGKGKRLKWLRTPGEVYRLEVEVPPNVELLRVSIRYIANQPTTNSSGHDCFGGRSIGVISPGTVLLYREGTDIDSRRIVCQLRLPHQWQAASALPLAEKKSDDASVVDYEAATLRTYVDSPIMCGRYYKTFNLVEEKQQKQIRPHVLHVFGDEATHADLNDGIVSKLQGMVTQTAKLIGSHPFDRFDILLAASDELPANGLEHSRSTFNVLSTSALRSPSTLKGWNRLLIPHEYLHAWCGKYRRPAGMLTRNFHAAKDTQLLWVYEGLTQYLGELVEARCGLMTPDEFQHRLTVELRNASRVQGRQWRTLADTAAASHILRAGSPSWGGLRRSQDYYMEGMLFWLEADARIRQLTKGKKSLDDFCRAFLGWNESAGHPRPFTRKEVVKELNAVAEFDWDGLISRRVESYQNEFDPAVAGMLGYKFSLTPQPPIIPSSTFRHRRGIDAYDSLGVVFSADGVVRNLLLGSPADKARLRPGMTVLGVNRRTWSGARLTEAISASQDRTPISLLVEDGDQLRTIQLHYHDGPRHWNLVRDKKSNDLLSEILKPRD